VSAVIGLTTTEPDDGVNGVMHDSSENKRTCCVCSVREASGWGRPTCGVDYRAQK
jgi:hypothetical protein